MPFVLGPVGNTKVKNSNTGPLGIDDPVGEMKNKDKEKCNRCIRDVNDVLWEEGEVVCSLG